MIVSMLVSAVKSMAQVVNPETATISVAEVSKPFLEDDVAAGIWGYKNLKGYPIASDGIWFATSHKRTLFHWDGLNLVVTDIFLNLREKTEKGDMVIEWFDAPTVQSNGSLTTYPEPSVNILVFTAGHGCKNKEVYKSASISYNKKNTVYSGITLGCFFDDDAGIELYFSYDVIVEKNKVTLRVYEEHDNFQQTLFLREFVVDK